MIEEFMDPELCGKLDSDKYQVILEEDLTDGGVILLVQRVERLDRGEPDFCERVKRKVTCVQVLEDDDDGVGALFYYHCPHMPCQLADFVRGLVVANKFTHAVRALRVKTLRVISKGRRSRKTKT